MPPARELAALLRALPPMDAALVEEPGRQTTIKTRYLAGAQQILRADRETLAPPAPEARERLLAAALAAVETSAVVILSDYGKGALAGGVAESVLARAGALGRPAIVDPKGRDFSRYLGATVVAPNRAELAAAAGSDGARGFEAEAARALIARFGFPAVLATLGRDGMLLVTEAEVLALPAEARDVFDVSGAGDTVVAALAAAMAAGAPLRGGGGFGQRRRRPGGRQGRHRRRPARGTRSRLAPARPDGRRGQDRDRRGRRRPGRALAPAGPAASASPTAASTCCIPATSRSWPRPRRPATGSSSA